MDYDFCGWVTVYNRRCADGRKIQPGAFKHCDGKEVPLVWNHDYNTISNVLGRVKLEDRPEGMFGYGSFNGTANALDAKEALAHSDIVAMSIYANHVRQASKDVVHGDIKEVSLVLAGANPGAVITDVLAHDDSSGDSMIIWHGDEGLTIDSVENAFSHAEEASSEEEKPEGGAESVKDVFNTLTEKQKNVVYFMIGQALENQKNGENAPETKEEPENVKHDDEGGDQVKYNAFDGASEVSTGSQNEIEITHDDMKEIVESAKREGGSLKAGFEAWRDKYNKNYAIAHADMAQGTAGVDYGIKDIEWLFPEARNLNMPPEFIKRDMEWVTTVMNGVHKSPFSRIKSMFADITADEARARGYTKGHRKLEEVFTLLKRTTTPTTIYKKQRIDRDDMIDITDFDVVAWIKKEMRWMLDEEIARAILVSDGRMASSDDKIHEENIRPIWKEDPLYAPKIDVVFEAGATENQRAKSLIRQMIKSRKQYKGSGNPILFTTEDMLTDMLLIEDENGRIIYDSVQKLQTTLRVSKIVTVPIMEDLTREDGGKTKQLLAIMVNLSDYNVGADKGGAISMFDDFDIDFNQYKYLMETRCSGALTKPYSALIYETEVTPVVGG